MIRRGLAVAAGAVVAGAVLAPLPAHAGTDVGAASALGKKAFSYSYSEGYCFYSKPLKKAMKVRVSGKLRYVRNAYKFNRGIRVRFHDPTLVEPKLTLATATKCSGGRAAKVSKARILQLWYDWNCKSSVGVVLGRGSQFGVSLSGTRSCGRTKVASRSTGYGAGSGFVQHNTGAPVGWSWGRDGKGIKKGGKICVRGDAGATIWTGNRSDTVVKPLKVCVPASYKGLS
ncbi:hypothetical protein GCM10009678_27680 [Actinomadura kijaniata]|uniref:Uncharacterized protein n=1 Tax=Actinomadura namibiensis TaxID=182080 RepID=A0A7W3LK98_ACTNM|nr:hypothetical protein [Actinomadura namibiensis]MBA8949701.1 hypothetical protein [Actinomadura namibiensis]